MLRILTNCDLTERNSFRVHQTASQIIEFDDPQEFIAYSQKNRIGQWMALGGGNNILFTKDTDFTLIVPVAKKINIVSEYNDFVTIKVDAGVEWDDLVDWSVSQELWGLENLSLIPGKVGAAPVQNIGAYGAEAKDTISRVEMIYVEEGKMVELAKEHCSFAYRESIFKHTLKGKVIITSVTFILSRIPSPKLGYGDVEREVERLGGVTLKNIRKAICTIRQSKLPDPAIIGNAGSFFKNPIVRKEIADALLEEYPEMPLYPLQSGEVKLAAGWLIDKCGLKGFKSDKVGVHDRQALVLINLGDATGEDVINFSRMVQRRVFEKFNIQIDSEVNIVQ